VTPRPSKPGSSTSGRRPSPSPNSFPSSTVVEREAGKAALVLGLCFISEGAIPFAAKDPLRVIPASIAGGALTGALSMYFGCKLMAPHGGLFVMLIPNAINHALLYLLAIVAGSLLTAVTYALLKRPEAVEMALEPAKA